MTNHPNRNWRRRMIESCERFLAQFHAPGAAALMSADDVRSIQSQAYQAGYADGRESTKRVPNDRSSI